MIFQTQDLKSFGTEKSGKQGDYYYVIHSFPIFSLDTKLETSVYTTQGVHE